MKLNAFSNVQLEIYYDLCKRIDHLIVLFILSTVIAINQYWKTFSQVFVMILACYSKIKKTVGVLNSKL